jgi:hypothetical protein
VLPPPLPSPLWVPLPVVSSLLPVFCKRLTTLTCFDQQKFTSTVSKLGQVHVSHELNSLRLHGDLH